VEGHREVANGKQRFGHRHREGLARIEGVADRLADEDQQGQHDRHGEEAGQPSQPWCLQVVLALAQEFPREGEPGGRPKPRKSSDVSVVIEPERMKGRKVSVATMALGK
jgi:hypothetical protein